MRTIALWAMLGVCAVAQTESGYEVHRTAENHAALMQGGSQTWRSAPGIRWGKQPYETQFRALWNDRGLYLLFDVDDPKPWHTMTKQDEHLWEEEVVEIFMDLDGSGQNYSEYEISPANVICDVRMVTGWPKPKSDLSWNHEGLESNVRRNNAGWSGIIFLPWPGFHSLSAASAKTPLPPKAGSSWKFNLYRIERPNGPADPKTGAILAAWSPTGQATFHVPSVFRPMIFRQ